MTTEPVSVDLFEWIGESMLRNIEEQPITVTVRLSDGSIEMPIGPKHPWFKELSRRKTEQVKRLRASLKTKLLSKNPNRKMTYDLNSKRPMDYHIHRSRKD
jgi:hypothetical protein